MKTKNVKGHAPTSQTIEESKLLKWLDETLKEIYGGEKTMVVFLAGLTARTKSRDLTAAIQNQIEVTERHLTRLEDIFAIIGNKPVAKKCQALGGLITEAEQIIGSTSDGKIRDTAIISACRKILHYKTATYDTLRAFAEILGLRNAATVFVAIVIEEKRCDELLEVMTAASGLQVEAQDDDI